MNSRSAKLIVCALALGLSVTACKKNKSTSEKAGDKVEEAGDKIEDKIDEAN